MKRIILCLFLFSLFGPTAANASGGVSFNFSSLNNLNRYKFSNGAFNYLPVKDYSKVLSKEEVSKVIKNIKIAAMILNIIALTGYTTNIVLGPFILNDKFQNEPYMDPIFYSHISVGLVSGLTAATVISLGYAELGIKSKYQIAYNRAYAISVFISTAFAAVELGLVAANLITSRLNPEAAKWVGLAHAISMGVSTIGLTVQFATSFLKDEDTGQ